MRFSGWVVLLLATPAAAAENYFNPGTMGPNAMPPSRAESPWVGDGWVAELGMAVQIAAPPPPPPAGEATFVEIEGTSSNQSATLPFHAEYRFMRHAALMVEGSPIEGWLVSGATQQAWGTPRPYGLAKADLRIGGKFMFFAGRGWWPAVTFRAWTKTTTGKSAVDHRFIDAPGYQFDLLLGEHFEVSEAFALELWVSGGFLAWQQAQFGQNDAPAWSVVASALWSTGTALRIHYDGYRGWQRNDKPQVLGVQLELPVKTPTESQPAVSVFVGLKYSLRDPRYLGLCAGVRVGEVGRP